MVDENTLIAGETGAGLFGVFKFFTGIKKFFKGITALGSLASNGRIPYTDADGNVNYVTPQQILDCVSTVNGNKSFTNDVSVGGALNVNGVNLDDKINGALTDYQEKLEISLNWESYDFNTFTKSGAYRIFPEMMGANRPLAYPYGILLVFYTGGCVVQIYIPHSESTKPNYRMFYDNRWTDWAYFI